jgi:aspartokinase/homoserine dehydrogenase 1
LSGTRNLISFTTARYKAEPLVITGPGAGAAVTAAGILNDIQYLAATP